MQWSFEQLQKKFKNIFVIICKIPPTPQKEVLKDEKARKRGGTSMLEVHGTDCWLEVLALQTESDQGCNMKQNYSLRGSADEPQPLPR